MRTRFALLAVSALLLAGPAQAVVKFYDASEDNGTPGIAVITSADLCPTTNPSMPAPDAPDAVIIRPGAQ